MIFTISLLLSFFLTSCVSDKVLVSNADYYPEAVWQNMTDIPYAKYFLYENKTFPLRYHCIKINLDDQNLKFNIFPNSEEVFFTKDGGKTNYFKGLTSKEFSIKHPSKIFINTTPFSGKEGSSDIIAKLTSTRQISGLHIVNKNELSSPIKKYSAICLKKAQNGYSAKIVKNQKDAACSEYDFAFGGFFTILTNFQKESFPYQKRDSRTAVGLSEDGKTLFILIVEGEKKSKSEGLSYPECADVMLRLGAANAMEMDGGGSTTLYINGKNMLSYSSSRKIAVFWGFN